LSELSNRAKMAVAFCSIDCVIFVILGAMIGYVGKNVGRDEG